MARLAGLILAVVAVTTLTWWAPQTASPEPATLSTGNLDIGVAVETTDGATEWMRPHQAGVLLAVQEVRIERDTSWDEMLRGAGLAPNASSRALARHLNPRWGQGELQIGQTIQLPEILGASEGETLNLRFGQSLESQDQLLIQDIEKAEQSVTARFGTEAWNSVEDVVAYYESVPWPDLQSRRRASQALVSLRSIEHAMERESFYDRVEAAYSQIASAEPRQGLLEVDADVAPTAPPQTFACHVRWARLGRSLQNAASETFPLRASPLAVPESDLSVWLVSDDGRSAAYDPHIKREQLDPNRAFHARISINWRCR